jgi:hypothetical protein
MFDLPSIAIAQSLADKWQFLGYRIWIGDFLGRPKGEVQDLPL